MDKRVDVKDKQELDSLWLSVLKKDCWVIDGNYKRTMSLRLSYADVVVFFYQSRFFCFWRVVKRIFKNYGSTCPDMGIIVQKNLTFNLFGMFGILKGMKEKRIFAVNESK